jgi:hypothetical protein
MQQSHNAIETAELDSLLRREAKTPSAYRARLGNVEEVRHCGCFGLITIS